jgi:hypothetical protein
MPPVVPHVDGVGVGELITFSKELNAEAANALNPNII